MCSVDIPELCLCVCGVCVMWLDCVAFVYMSESLNVYGVVSACVCAFIVLCLCACVVCAVHVSVG